MFQLTFPSPRPPAASEWARTTPLGYEDTIHKCGGDTIASYEFSSRWEGFFRFDSSDANVHKPKDSTNTYLLGFNRYLWLDARFQANHGWVDDPARKHLTQTVISQVPFPLRR